MVDSMRRAPTSYADLTYHSQIVYQFIPKDAGRPPLLVKFRLVPGRPSQQSGLLEEHEQEHPWDTKRRASDNRSRYYLRNEFMQRMEGFEAIRYVLQMQTAPGGDDAFWNPQMVFVPYIRLGFAFRLYYFTLHILLILFHRTIIVVVLTAFLEALQPRVIGVVSRLTN